MLKMSINENIRNYILTELLTEQASVKWDDDTDIISSGILDSLSIVRLLVYVEDTFKINLDDSLDLDNFKSVNSISTIVNSKIA